MVDVALEPDEQAALAFLEQISRLDNAGIMETVLLWHLGFGPGAPVPAPHPGEPTPQERRMVRSLARYLNTATGYAAGSALAAPLAAYLTTTLAGTGLPMPGDGAPMWSNWVCCLDGTGER